MRICCHKIITGLIFTLFVYTSFSQRRLVPPPKPIHKFEQPARVVEIKNNKTPVEVLLKEKFSTNIEYEKTYNRECAISRAAFKRTLIQNVQTTVSKDSYIFISRSILFPDKLSIESNNRKAVITGSSLYNDLETKLKDIFPGETVENIYKNIKILIDVNVDPFQIEKIIRPKGNEPFFIHLEGSTYKPVKFENGKKYIMHDRFNLEVKDAFGLLCAKKMLSRPTNAERVVISLINNDGTTERYLSNNIKNRIQVNKNNYQSLLKILSDNKNKEIFIVGHIENGNYVSKDRLNQSEFKINLKMIEQFANQNELPVYLLGCESILNQSSSGYNKDVKSLELLEQLKQSFSATTLSDFYSRLSLNADRRFYVNTEIFKNTIKLSGRLFEIEKLKQAQQNKAFISSAAVYSRIASSDTALKKSAQNMNNLNDSRDSELTANNNPAFSSIVLLSLAGSIVFFVFSKSHINNKKQQT